MEKNEEINIKDDFINYIIKYKPITEYVYEKFENINSNEIINIIKLIFKNQIHIKITDISSRNKFLNKNKIKFESNKKDELLMKSEFLKQIINDMHNIAKKINKNSILYRTYMLQSNADVMLVMLKNKEISEDELSEWLCVEFLKIHSLYTIEDDYKPECWIYKNGIYVPNGVTSITQFCRIVLGVQFKKRFYTQVVDKLRNDTFIDKNDFFINEAKNLIPVQNGIYDLNNNKLIPFRSEYKFFSKIPIKYEKTKKCPLIIDFFKNTLINGDMNVIQELIGYTLLRDYPFSKAVMFSGDGSNGKSKLLELIKRFVGVENTTNIPLHSLESQPFIVSHFLNKLVNLGADIGSNTLKDTSVFKTITGHDIITADRKFKSPIEFTNYAKQYFSANKIPKVIDFSDGFFRRWVIIKFNNKFVSNEVYNNTEDKTNLKVADPLIIEKITSDKELSGLFNWAIEGLNRLLKQNDLSLNESTKDIRNFWLRESSSLNGFIMDCITDQKYGSYITKQEFKQVYLKYCREHKLRPESDQMIKNKLTIECGASEGRPIINGMQTYCWQDIEVEGAKIHKDNDDFGIKNGGE